MSLFIPRLSPPMGTQQPCFFAGTTAVTGSRGCQASSETATTTFPRLFEKPKEVWIWTKCPNVMTAAVERGWNTFVFPVPDRNLAEEWSSLALIQPLFLEHDELFDCEQRRIATFAEVSSPQKLQHLQVGNFQADNIVVDFLDWQIIPAENIVAAFQDRQNTVLAVSNSVSEAKTYMEALEHGLDGVVFRVEDTEAVLELKEYLDKRNESNNYLSLTKAVVTKVQVVGTGDRVCVDLCSTMRPKEGLLVGSFARGLFLVHSECLESNYIASRPFRVNAGPVHSYVAIPGGKTAYLSELKAGREVIVADQTGKTKTAIVGRVKVETRPLIMVEAKTDSTDETHYTIFLQNAETVSLVPHLPGNRAEKTAIPVTSLKAGDEVLVHLQGGARHTGLEIQEFIVEN